MQPSTVCVDDNRNRCSNSLRAQCKTRGDRHSTRGGQRLRQQLGQKARSSAMHIPLLPGRPRGDEARREPRGDWLQLVGQVSHECTVVGLMSLVAQLVLPLLLAPCAAAVFGVACSPSRIPVPSTRTRRALSWPIWRMVSGASGSLLVGPFQPSSWRHGGS